MIHALIAIAAFILHPLAGLAAAAFFVGREVTQAEYRWIETYGSGKRPNMPWYGGFDPRAWNFKSVTDAALPVAVAAIAWVLL